jgi:hypothetical protein
MDPRQRIFKKLFLRFPSPMQTRSAPSFFIYKKSLKFDGGYCAGGGIVVALFSHKPVALVMAMKQ